MRIKNIGVWGRGAGEVVAEFGGARLIRTAAGHLELRGGSGPERAEAREWASLFLGTEYVVWQPAGD